jgi:hypothetical protein
LRLMMNLLSYNFKIQDSILKVNVKLKLIVNIFII